MGAIIIFAAILLVLGVRYAQLCRQLSRSRQDWQDCRDYLMALGQEMARYAFSHQGFLPHQLGPLMSVLTPKHGRYMYRYVPRLYTDSRLILAYDDAPRHTLMAFPRVVPGRLVLFASGKVALFEEGVVHQLIVGDNVLRCRLGLPEVLFMEVLDGGE